jgi:hypothetical protein
MATLFQTTPQNITMHLRNIANEGGMPEEGTKHFLQVRHEGNRAIRRRLLHYRLDVVLDVGRHVRSHRGPQFNEWATRKLRKSI